MASLVIVIHNDSNLVNSIPLWAIFGFLAAFLSATQMLLQEKFKTDGLPMAFWSKVACGLVMTPFVIMYGLPHNPNYYFLLILQSLLWVVSDVIFYRGVSEDGAGIIARIIPVATIISFFLWFLIDWHLVGIYFAKPWNSFAITAVLFLSAFFSWQLKKCTFTWQAFKRVWFVIVASILGSVSTKYITQQVDISQGTYAYVFIEAWIMLIMWTGYYFVMRPIPKQVMFGSKAIRSGLTVGLVGAFTVTTTVYAVYHIDNPAFVSAIKYLDSILILLFYRVTSRPSRGNIWAGLGIVFCAITIIILKSQSL